MTSQNLSKTPRWLYSTYFNDPAFSDMTLKLSDGTEILVHRIVLCRGSKYFSELIIGGLGVSIYLVGFACTIMLTH